MQELSKEEIFDRILYPSKSAGQYNQMIRGLCLKAMEEYRQQEALRSRQLEEALEFIVNNHVMGDDIGLRAHCAAALNKYRNAP